MNPVLGIRRIIGFIFIGIALWLFFPIPGPDDILNVALGGCISEAFGFNIVACIIATYTIIPFVLLYIGCVIFPGNTHNKFHGILAKIKTLALKVVTNPKLLLVAVIMIAILYYVYVTFIGDMVAESLGTIAGFI